MTFSIGNIKSLYNDLHTATNKTANHTNTAASLADDKVTLGWQEPTATYQHLAADQTAEATAPNDQPVASGYLPQLMQAMLDQRTGLDRKKWQELQEKIDALQSLDELTEGQQQELEQLLKAQQALMQQAAERMRQQAEQQDTSSL